MENILKKCHLGIIPQFHAIQGFETTHIKPPSNMQQLLSTYSSVFELPTSLPPTQGEHDHSIPFIPGIHPPNLHPYRYTFSHKNEIEKIIQELLVVGVIRPSTNHYSSPFVMVLNKEGEWRMCPNFHSLNKLKIKDKFPILVIDDLLDEIHGAQYFTTLDLHLGYIRSGWKRNTFLKLLLIPMKATTSSWLFLWTLQCAFHLPKPHE